MSNLSYYLRRYPFGVVGAIVVFLFVLVGVYAPFLASSKPIAMSYGGVIYFPLFRYLFFLGFFTKPLDIFFNILMFTFPFFLLSIKYPKLFGVVFFIQFALFIYLLVDGVQDPASDISLARKRFENLQNYAEKMRTELIPPLSSWSWKNELSYMSPYAKLNEVTSYIEKKEHNEVLVKYTHKDVIPSLWQMDKAYQKEKEKNLNEYLNLNGAPYLQALNFITEVSKVCDASCLNIPLIKASRFMIRDYEQHALELDLIDERQKWLEKESSQVEWMIMPLIRPFHWEQDAGGDQALNQVLPWWELTRINRKDLVAALIFGVRISLVVGFLAVALALLIGVPIGAWAGYYGGKFDIIVSRLLEVWESMPTFFMLLLVVAIVQSKSIFIVIGVIGLFGWTSFSRYIRGEFFKQRSLSYVEACSAIGFPDRRIIFKEVLPNAIPPLLTLLPFAMMGAISSEAGLSFLGLGEEGSCSWGVLMDEGRSAFPGEAYLLWPPAIMLTTLLIAIALVGDALRDALDPKLKR